LKIMSQDSKNKSRPRVLMELRPSGISGIGVFAVRNIPKGQKVADGLYAEDFKTLVPWENYQRFDASVRRKIDDFCIGTPKGFVPPDDVDFNKLSIEWYFNHSCDGNVGFNLDGDFVAIKRISKGSELTYDYGIAESNPRFRMRCKCQAKTCRRIITGNDWKQGKLGREKGRYMLPQLRKIHSQ
jgi:SET domain-containing protein